MDTAFEKDTASGAMDKGFICIKAILKYRHGSFSAEQTKPWTCEASRNHEVPWLYPCGAKPCLY